MLRLDLVFRGVRCYVTAMGRIAAFSLMLALLVPGYAFSQNSTYYQTGNDLHDSCRNGPLLVIGYVEGVIDGRQFLSDAFCIPVGVEARQMKDVVCKAIDANPANRHAVAAALVVAALKEAWPCQ